MLEKGKVSSGEFLILVILFSVGGAILTAPSLLVSIAKQDVWISYIIATCVGLSFIFLYSQLASIYPSHTYVEVNEKIFGKWIGKFTALLFLSYIYYLSCALLREIGEFFTTQILVETPIEVTMMIFILTCLIGVRLGLEVICRTIVIFFPWMVGLLFMLFIFLIPESKFINIQPVLGEGMKPILNGAYHSLALPYSQLVFFLMITPYVIQKASMIKNFFKGTLIGGIVLFLIIIFSIFVLGADFTARQTYPSYILAKKISIGDFLERIEAIIAIIWIFTVYFKLTIIYYALSLGLAQVTGLKNYKILHVPIGLLIFTYALLSHPNMVHYSNFIATTWTPYSLTICLMLPLLLLIVGKIRGKRSALGK